MNSPFNIFPIGFVRHTEIQLFEKFIPGLKNLELFSHCWIFWQVDDHPVQFNLVRLKNIDAANGLLQIEPGEIPQNATILDLKAGIPLADRVPDSKIPEDCSKEISFSAPAAPPLPNDSGELIAIGKVVKQDGRKLIQIEPPFLAEFNRLEGFSHVHVLWWFHRLAGDRFRRILQVQPPYEKAPRSGVFATRSPVRPNPLAVTISEIVRLDPVRGILETTALDAFEGTPILGVRPYRPEDCAADFRVPPWMAHWPEWYVEEVTDTAGDPNSLIPADAERLKTFELSDEPSPETETKMPAPTAAVPNRQDIFIRGARQHNLKNIDVTIPWRQLTVITGVSGSGKSSLAFDTLYAEGQRRYVESLSTVARQALSSLEKPAVDHIYNLTPTVAIEQKTLTRNPRSTVGTLTEVADFLRVLFAKIGTRHCPECNRGIHPQTPFEMTDQLARLVPGAQFHLLPPAGDETNPEGPRFQVPESSQPDWKKSLSAAVQLVLNQANGSLKVLLENGESFVLTEHQACPHCHTIFFELHPAIFSFNSPDGMCPACNGLGVQLRVDPQLVVTQPDVSLLDGASPWFGVLRKVKPSGNWMRSELFALADLRHVDLELPWNQLPEKFRHEVLYGTGDEVLNWSYDMKKRGRSIEFQRPAEGAVNHISRLLQKTDSEAARKRLLDFLRELPCDVCQGERLCAEARFVTVGGTRFPEVSQQTIGQVHDWLAALPERLSPAQKQIAAELLNELRQRVQSLLDVGLHYLTFDRPAPTLSGGEGQRLRLATQLGSGLTGMLYVLDEPSIGLHPRDHQRLIGTLQQLRDSGNTVVVVEHDAATMRAADWLIDLGPGAGEFGGEVLAAGTPEEVMARPESLTGQYLNGTRQVTSHNGQQRKSPRGWLKLTGARLHNLKNIQVRFPLGVLTCVTGVSGSGKSSLVSQTLSPAINHFLKQPEELVPGPYDRLEGMEAIDKLVQITQNAIGRTPRSNPGTYTGVFDKIRQVFADTPAAKSRKFKAGRFSFNGKEGRCEACEGNGRIKVEMHFLPDVWVPCNQCHGRRFNPETLEILYGGKSIADVLEMDVTVALQFFGDQPEILTMLQTLQDVGLDYLKLGQSALTLSGGEAQRIKLAKELCQPQTGRTLYILDEPTTGLHFADIQKLLDVLHRLTDAGNTIIVIEHNPDVIQTADWVIELGPDGGDGGGFVVFGGAGAGE